LINKGGSVKNLTPYLEKIELNNTNKKKGKRIQINGTDQQQLAAFL